MHNRPSVSGRLAAARKKGKRLYKQNKYKNKKTTIDNITFDSKNESNRYLELKILLKSGLIKDLVLQPAFELQPKFKYQGKTERSITYKADFQYTEDGKTVVEDVKGFETKDFIIKRKLFLNKYGNDIDFRIIR